MRPLTSAVGLLEKKDEELPDQLATCALRGGYEGRITRRNVVMEHLFQFISVATLVVESGGLTYACCRCVKAGGTSES